jgi:hypothetical protein
MTDRTATVTIGGKEYALTAMTIAEFRRSRKLGEQVKELLREGKATTQAVDDLLDAATAIIHASLQRSAPNLTLEALEAAITYADVRDIFTKLVKISMPEPETGGLIQ